MAESGASNAEWFTRARQVIPGGVDSPVRSFASVGGIPYTVVSGQGPYVVDAEGTRYIDLVQSYGAVLLGHAHPVVTAAINAAAAAGTTFGAPTPGEVLLAEAICARVTGCEQVRLVSSGTEAAMSAVRLARGATGRDRIIGKFGTAATTGQSGRLAEPAGGSGVATLGLPGSAGVPAGAVADTVVAPYNVVPDMDDTVACVIVEAVAANMNLVAPAPGFLAGLRAACDAAGALLIFDEVITGFRLGPGGATAWSGVTPDLWCFGKVIGGGLPVGAFGGRTELLAALAPGGPVYLKRARPRGIRWPRRPGWPCWTRWDRPSTTRWAPGWASGPRSWSRPSPVAAWPWPHRPSARWSDSSWRRLRRPRSPRRPTTCRPRSWRVTAPTEPSSTPCCAGAWRLRRGPTRCSFPA